MVKKVKIKIDPPSDHKRVSDEEIQQLLDAADGYLKVKYFIPMIKFTLETGLRRQELADLTWDAIKYQQRFIQVSLTKTGYPRRIPLTSKIKEILSTGSPNPSTHYNIPDSAPVFTHSVRSIECAFKRVKIGRVSILPCICSVMRRYRVCSSRVCHQSKLPVSLVTEPCPNAVQFTQTLRICYKRWKGICHEAGIYLRFSDQ